MLSALTSSCHDVVNTANAKAHGSMLSEATIPWSAAVSDLFDGISIVDDGLTYRLEDCMIKLNKYNILFDQYILLNILAQTLLRHSAVEMCLIRCAVLVLRQSLSIMSLSVEVSSFVEGIHLDQLVPSQRSVDQ